MRFVKSPLTGVGCIVPHMAEIFVERKPDSTYVARRNKQVVASGSTQAETAAKAHKKFPEDVIFGERVRDTAMGSPDKWRRLY